MTGKKEGSKVETFGPAHKGPVSDVASSVGSAEDDLLRCEEAGCGNEKVIVCIQPLCGKRFCAESIKSTYGNDGLKICTECEKKLKAGTAKKRGRRR